MALKKRLIWSESYSDSLAFVGNNVSAEAQLAIIFVNEGDDETTDIITHGKSFIQDPLNARELKISGLDEVGAIATTVIGGKTATTGEGDNAVTTLLAITIDGNALDLGIDLNNLSIAIGLLNDYVDRVKVANELSITRQVGDNVPEGIAAQYVFTLGEGTDDEQELETKINIPKDLFLKSVDFIPSASDQDVTAATPSGGTAPFATGDPVLKFTWLIDDNNEFAAGEDSTDNEGIEPGRAINVSYVPVKELVDTYVEYTNTHTANSYNTLTYTPISADNAYVRSNGVSAVTETAVSGDALKYDIAVTLEEADGTNGAGKAIKVTLPLAAIDGIAKGSVAEENAIAVATLMNDVTTYELIGKTTDVFAGISKTVTSVLNPSTGEFIPGYSNHAIVDNALGATTGVSTFVNSGSYTVAVDSEGVVNNGHNNNETITTSVVDVINNIGEILLRHDIELDDVAAKAGAASSMLDSLRVNNKLYEDVQEGDKTLKKVALFGSDIKLSGVDFEEGSDWAASTEIILGSESDSALGFTGATTLLTAIEELEAAWAWGTLSDLSN